MASKPNKFPAKCYICGQPCGPGDGFVQKYGKMKWRVRHSACNPKKQESK